MSRRGVRRGVRWVKWGDGRELGGKMESNGIMGLKLWLK